MRRAPESRGGTGRRGAGGAGSPVARWALALVLGLGTVAVLRPLLDAGFLNYDDNIYVTANRHVTAGFTREGLAWAAFNADFNWHPITWLSHMADSQMFGLWPAGHHLTSVLLHALNVALLFWLLARLTGALWPAALTAALFAVHPLHVEPVAWISARKDLLNTLFWFLALLAYLRFVERRGVRRYALVCLCAAASFFCKGMAVTLPLTLLIVDYWPLNRWALPGPGSDGAPGRALRRNVRLLVEKVPLVQVCLAGMLLQVLGQRRPGAVRSLAEAPVTRRLGTVAVSYVTYVAKLFWPWEIAIPYPMPPYVDDPLSVAACLLALAAASAVAWRVGRVRRYVLAGWLWYLVTLVPVIGFVPLGHNWLADRYTYVSFTGLFVLLAWGAADLAAGRRWLRGLLVPLALAAVVACAVASHGRAREWSDSITLFSRSVAVTRDNFVAESNLADALDAAGITEAALGHYRELLRIDPGSPWGYAQIGALLLRTGRYAEAEPHLETAVRLDPGAWGPRVNLGLALLGLGNADAARRQFESAVRLAPGSAQAHFGLAQALEGQGRLADAAVLYARTVELDPALPDAHFRYARVLEDAGRIAEAIGEYRAELRLHPGHPGAEAGIRSASGRIGAAAPPPQAGERNEAGVVLAQIGQLAAAEKHFREAVALDPQNLLARLNLGTVCLQRADYGCAREQFEFGVQRDPGNAVAQYGLAQALENEGRRGEALPHYERALRAEPKMAWGHYRFGLALEAEGRIDEAIARLREAVRLDPQHEPARAALRRLGVAEEAPR